MLRTLPGFLPCPINFYVPGPITFIFVKYSTYVLTVLVLAKAVSLVDPGIKIIGHPAHVEDDIFVREGWECVNLMILI